jgi:hypothetical protein
MHIFSHESHFCVLYDHRQNNTTSARDVENGDRFARRGYETKRVVQWIGLMFGVL